jgi:hypothetical protein
MKTTKPTGYAEQATDEKPVAFIEITKIVREERPIMGSTNGLGYGAYVDQVLKDAALKGEDIQSFTININEDAWRDYADITRHNNTKAY